MRQKLFIFLGLIGLGALLVGLNAASYTQKEKIPDSEMKPNRSTYNTGATGTRAFFDLLAETGRRPVRWQESPAALLRAAKTGGATNGSNAVPHTFVVIGPLARPFADQEVERLMRWVADGGRLVVIDREPREDLLSTTADWMIKAVPSADFPLGVDSSNQMQMTDKTAAVKPVQPSVFTRGVNAVQPSRFASSAALTFFDQSFKRGVAIESPMPPRSEDVEENFDGRSGGFKASPPAPAPVFRESEAKESREGKLPPLLKQSSGETGREGENENAADAEQEPEENEVATLKAPVVHLAGGDKTLLVDFPYGAGQIVYLSDPYIVSNAGVNLADNAQAAINIVVSRGDDNNGTIAFDEFHHGYGAGENRLLAYFAETPVPAIFAQVVLLVAVVLFTRSRRFARALPAREPNRLSKLEYVAAMAELQRRTRAYDLALENIYSEFRRTTARLVGADNFQTPRRDLARMLAEKGDFAAAELENLMLRCEDIIHGDQAGGRHEVLHLASRLREIEQKLGLKRARKQLFRK